MYSNNAYNTYRNNSVNYASKEQLLLLLVDGAVKYAKIGRQAILDKDVSKANINLVKTQNIFYELIGTLDLKKAGDWGHQLISVYRYIVNRLIQANVKKDISIMDEVIPLIEEVRDTWNEAYEASKGML